MPLPLFPPFQSVRRLLILAAALCTPAAHAFNLLGSAWPDGDITMVLALGATPAQPLNDGAADFNAVAESALQEWNQHLTRSRFVSTRNLDAPRGRNNRVNNVFFDINIYGMSFGENVLAVTLGQSSGTTGRTVERDVVFNASLTWNSYRGALQPTIREFRRVALHEFGHVIGLDHPDKDNPPQTVNAVMNSIVSTTETLQADDISGARALYDANAGQPPAIAAHPQSRIVAVGHSYTMSVTAGGSGPLTYAWSFTALGTNESEPLQLANGPSYTIGSVQLADAGTYRCFVTGAAGGIAISNAATLTVTPVTTNADTTLVNLSTRGIVGTDSDVMIAGFVIDGTTSKNVFIRAAGPALNSFGVSGTLADPVLRIVNSSGQTVAENNDWQTQSDPATTASAITAAGDRLGAFAFPPGSRDAAILTQLPPGSYTAVVSGLNNTTGVALVEAYDADADPATQRSRKLVNIATRGQVRSGDNVLIAGLVVEGPGPRTYLIRAIGPTLARDFGVTTAMPDPFLQVFQGETLLRENDDWDAPESAQPALRQASQRVGAFPMQETRNNSGLDAAMLMTLQPGSYTAKLSGFEGSTGVGLIEIYEVP